MEAARSFFEKICTNCGAIPLGSEKIGWRKRMLALEDFGFLPIPLISFSDPEYTLVAFGGRLGIRGFGTIRFVCSQRTCLSLAGEYSDMCLDHDHIAGAVEGMSVVI
jgi:hypothetical protein